MEAPVVASGGANSWPHLLDPAKSRRTYTAIAAAVATIACLQVTNVLLYYPSGWRFLLLAALAVAWFARPGVGQILTLAFLVVPAAYSLQMGQTGFWLAGAVAFAGAILLDPFGFLVVLVCGALISMGQVAGLVVAAPLIASAGRPPRAVLAAVAAATGLLVISLLVGHTVASGVLPSPDGNPLVILPSQAPASLTDWSWWNTPDAQQSAASGALASGLWKPIPGSPILLGEVALWGFVALLASRFLRQCPWADLLGRVEVPVGSLEARRTASVLLLSAVLIGVGELALVSATGAPSIDIVALATSIAFATLIVGICWPVLGKLPEGLTEPGGRLLFGPLPSERARARSGPPTLQGERGAAAPSRYRRPPPSDTWADLAGVEDMQREIEEAIASQFDPKVAATLKRMSLRPTKGVLLFGPPGTGKTKIARVIAAQAHASFFAISGSEFSTKYFGESEANLRKIFDEARTARPAVIFFDELDAFLPRRTEMSRADAPEKRVVATFLGLTDGVAGLDGVMLVGATNYPDQVDEAALRPGRFDKLIYVAPPNRAARREILARYLAQRTLAPDVDLDALADKTERFTGADLQAICVEATRKALRRATNSSVEPLVTSADLLSAVAGAKPTVTFEMIRRFETLADQYGRRSDKPADVEIVERPKLTWDDVAGLAEVKEALKESVELPLQHPELYREYGVQAPKGVLMFGPPGCGKTFLARVVASVSGAHFLDVKGPELLRSLVGESEANIRNLFDRARENAPCVLFFDEIDAIAGARGSHEATNTKVLTQLLTEMDGADGLKGVVVIAATNRPDTLDAALMRPGRFDRVVYVPPPDQAAREALLAHALGGKPTSDDIDVGRLAALTDGWSGADLSTVCAATAIAAAKLSVKQSQKVVIDMTMLVEQIGRTRPSLSKDQLADYEGLYDKLRR